MDFLVFGACGLAAAFVLAWLVSPRFRQSMERPKHLLQERLNHPERHRRL